jgi:hypothetical protein
MKNSNLQKILLACIAAVFLFITARYIWNALSSDDATEETVAEENFAEEEIEIVEEEIEEEIVDDRINRPLRTYFPWMHDEDFAEQMPLFDHLSDPFEFFAYSVGADAATLAAYGIPANGRVETAAHWELRRAEIRDLMMYYYYGYLWPTTAENVTVNTLSRPVIDSGINITVNEVRLDGTAVAATGEVAAGVWLPSFEQLAANGFWCLDTDTGSGGPLLIATFHGFNEEQRNGFLERGIGLALATGVPGWDENRGGMYFDLFPFDAEVTEYNTGTLMASAWTFSRIIDAFELNPSWGVNANAIAVLGNSFSGKRALFAGIMDERVALTVPHESGGDGGVAPFRHSHAGRIHYYNADGINRVHSRHETSRTGNAGRGASGEAARFFRRSAPYEESIFLLPFDMHLAIALTAPTAANPNRAFLSLETDNFGTWTGWGPARTANAAAAEVFHFLGSDNIAFRQRHSGHMLQDSDYPVIWAALDYLFGNAVHDTQTGFRGGRSENQIYLEDIWNSASPGVFENFSALTRSPVDIDSAWFPWSRPGAHTLWTDAQIISGELFTRFNVYTSAQKLGLLIWSENAEEREWWYDNYRSQFGDDGRFDPDNLPSGVEYWYIGVRNGVARIDIDSFGVPDEMSPLTTARYEFIAYGGDLEPRIIFVQAIDVHTALRHGTTRDNVGGAGNATMVGFTSRINPDTVRAYQRDADGNETEVNLSRHQAGGHWIMPYGVRFGGITGAGDERAHILRGLQFEAMPGFTFELSLQENLHTQDQTPAIWAASPATQIIGPYPHWRPGGTGARPTAEPLPPAANRRSTFDTTLTHSFTTISAEHHEWQITFSNPINPRDFGIGFNFSENFALHWNDDNTSLTISFNHYIGIQEGDELIMYIFRARAYGTNDWGSVINTPIRHAIRM